MASRNVGCFLRRQERVEISGLGRARGTRSVFGRPRNCPLPPKKTLEHRFAYIATSAHVSDANDFVQFVCTKTHAKKNICGQGTNSINLLCRFDWLMNRTECSVNCYHFHDDII